MDMKTVKVQGLQIRIQPIHEMDYVSLTDIVKGKVDEPKETIRNWIKTSNTVRFLWAWEEIHNPDFTGDNLSTFIGRVTDNRYNLSPSKWITETNAVGLISKRGRYNGGTYAHKDIALEFCSWFDPYFKVYLMKAFQELQEQASERQNLAWHVSKITDNVEEIRSLLDTIPGQQTSQKRLLGESDNSKGV